MDDKYYIEFDPHDKFDDIFTTLKEYNPKVYSKTDDGYDWIEEDDTKCIVLENPYDRDNLVINVGDSWEFTISIGKNHCHFLPYLGIYEEMINVIKDILNNDVCVASIKDCNGRWFGSRFIQKDQINKDPKEIFDSIFENYEFNKLLTNNGFIMDLNFWNPVDDLQIKGK